MGIKDLNSFLKLKAPNSMIERQLNYYWGKSIAIDTSIFLYKFIYKNNRYLEGFFQQIYRLRSNGLKPIYVFDGIPTKHKTDVINMRRDKKKKVKNKTDILKNQLKDPKLSSLSKLDIQCQINQLTKKVIYVTNKHIEKLKYFLDLINVEYHQADGEADSYCSSLLKDGKVDLCLSDDMDFLASGSKKLLRNFNVSSNLILEYDLDIILQTLKLSKNEWIDFCILCGCDYTSRIRGIGSKYAYKLIKEYGNIENIISKVYKDTIPYNFNYQAARDIFNTCDNYKYIDKFSTKRTIYGKKKLDELKYFLRENTNLSDYQLNLRLNRIIS